MAVLWQNVPIMMWHTPVAKEVIQIRDLQELGALLAVAVARLAFPAQVVMEAMDLLLTEVRLVSREQAILLLVTEAKAWNPELLVTGGVKVTPENPMVVAVQAVPRPALAII